jgi:hypothetical protein
MPRRVVPDRHPRRVDAAVVEHVGVGEVGRRQVDRFGLERVSVGELRTPPGGDKAEFELPHKGNYEINVAPFLHRILVSRSRRAGTLLKEMQP